MSLESCSYNELSLNYDEFSLHNYPTNINTNNINLCKLEKCKLINKLEDTGEIVIKKQNTLYNIHLTGNNSGYIKFNGIKYSLNLIILTKGTSHYYDNKSYETIEMILHLSSDINKKLLLIIPFKKAFQSSIDETSQSFEKIFKEINKNFKNDTSSSFVSNTELNFKKILPPTQFFFYNVKENLNNNVNDFNVIVYSPSNSFTIKEELIYSLLSNLECNNAKSIYLKNDLDKIRLPIYYSSNPPILDDINGDDIYIDCKPVETQEPDKEYTTYFADMINSTSGGDLNKVINDSINYVIKVMFAGIVIGLIVYFPKIFESKSNTNSNGNGNNSIIQANARPLSPSNMNKIRNKNLVKAKKI